MLTFTSGEHAYFERLMKGIPNFDKSPPGRDEIPKRCRRCRAFRPETGGCRYGRCPGGTPGNGFYPSNPKRKDNE